MALLTADGNGWHTVLLSVKPWLVELSRLLDEVGWGSQCNHGTGEPV